VGLAEARHHPTFCFVSALPRHENSRRIRWIRSLELAI
jgi:hypothetical protein